MEVTTYISQLLHQHECVILPDFGGFVTNYQSACIDFANNSFYPPRKDILFNRQLTQNDGLLINYLAQVEGIEYVESKKMVVGFVKTSLEKLKSGRRLIFEGIGNFYYDESKILQFEPDLSANYLLDSYGFSSFHFPALEENTKIVKRTGTAFADKKPEHTSRKRLLKRVLVAAPFVLLIGYFPIHNQILNKQHKTEQVSMNPMGLFIGDSSSATPTSTTSPSNINIIGRHNLAGAFDVFKTDNEQNPETEVVFPVLENRFYIIAGSCSNQPEAENFADKIAQKGYNPILLDPNKGRFRIALAGFATKDEALAELSSYRKNEFPTAWVWGKK